MSADSYGPPEPQWLRGQPHAQWAERARHDRALSPYDEVVAIGPAPSITAMQALPPAAPFMHDPRLGGTHYMTAMTQPSMPPTAHLPNRVRPHERSLSPCEFRPHRASDDSDRSPSPWLSRPEGRPDHEHYRPDYTTASRYAVFGPAPPGDPTGDDHQTGYPPWVASGYNPATNEGHQTGYPFPNGYNTTMQPLPANLQPGMQHSPGAVGSLIYLGYNQPPYNQPPFMMVADASDMQPLLPPGARQQLHPQTSRPSVPVGQGGRQEARSRPPPEERRAMPGGRRKGRFAIALRGARYCWVKTEHEDYFVHYKDWPGGVRDGDHVEFEGYTDGSKYPGAQDLTIGGLATLLGGPS